MPFTVLLVDDEPLAREGLRMLLARDTEVAAIYEARNGQEAVAAIETFTPNLVFLDVQMPNMDGFEVTQKVGAEQMPQVVFVTAHDKYVAAVPDSSEVGQRAGTDDVGRGTQAIVIFASLLALSALAYIPLAMIVSPGMWFA